MKLSLIFLLLFSCVAEAITYTVNTNTDTGAGTGTTGDLRYVFTTINATLDAAPTINFELPGGMTTITLTSALPALTATSTPTLNILSGQNSVTIDGSNTWPGLYIAGSTSSSSLTITFNVADADQSFIINNCPNDSDFPWNNSANVFTGIFTKTGSGSFVIQTNSETYNYTDFQLPLLITGGDCLIAGPVYTTTPDVQGLWVDAEYGCTVANGCVFGRTGTTSNEFAPLVIQSGGTLTTDPGVLTINGAVRFLTGLNGNSTVSSTITATSIGTVVLNQSTDFSQATLSLQEGTLSTSPTIYVPLTINNGLITQPFNQVLINGTPSPGSIYYSPQSAPNSVLLASNISEGISSANIVFGTQSFDSTILSDPCAGIVVIALLSPSELQSVLNSFFTHQSTLSIQALSSITANLNYQISQRRFSTVVSGGSSVSSAWKNPRALFASNEETTKEQNSAPFFTLLGNEPNFSFSTTLIGQFQYQDPITTSNASFSAYETRSGGVSIAFDYLGLGNALVGVAATYVYTHLGQAHDLGTQDTQSYYGTVYAGWVFDNLTFDILVTADYNRTHGVRNFPAIPGASITIPEVELTFQTPGLPGGTADSVYNSYQLAPHFDLNYEVSFNPSISLLPFLSSDFIIIWESPFSETGGENLIPSACGASSSLNLAYASYTSYFLQNEVGLNLFEQVDLLEKGRFIFRQKISYVNRYTLPFTFREKFVGEAEFTATSIRLPMQSMFGSAVEMIYRLGTFSVNLSYESMIGSGFMLNAAFLRIDKDF